MPDKTEAECSSMYGTYQGDFTNCTPDPCSQPAPTGACCIAGGCHEDMTSSQCSAQQGLWLGPDSTCQGECPELLDTEPYIGPHN
jgi:hypothetical protein